MNFNPIMQLCMSFIPSGTCSGIGAKQTKKLENCVKKNYCQSDEVK